MDITAIKEIVETQLGGWTKTDQELLDAGMADSTSFQDRYITEIDIINEADPKNPRFGNGIIDKLEGAAAVDSLVARVLTWLKPGERTGVYGINIGHANARAYFVALVPSLLTEAETDAILALTTPKSIWDAAGLSGVQIGHIQQARSL